MVLPVDHELALLQRQDVLLLSLAGGHLQALAVQDHCAGHKTFSKGAWGFAAGMHQCLPGAMVYHLPSVEVPHAGAAKAHSIQGLTSAHMPDLGKIPLRCKGRLSVVMSKALSCTQVYTSKDIV